MSKGKLLRRVGKLRNILDSVFKKDERIMDWMLDKTLTLENTTPAIW